MMTKEQYEKYLAKFSEEPCGFGNRTIKECQPPSLNNQKCAICNKYLWK